MRTMILSALVVAFLPFAGDLGRAQVDKAARGTVFFAGTSAHSVTIMRNGGLLATFTFPMGTALSAVDEHRQPTHLGSGRFEFHGAFELRALTADDRAAQQPYEGMPAAEIMSRAPLVIMANGVDVLLENVRESKD